jgi:hypothetical protein
MASKKKGLAGLFTQYNPYLITTHCVAHQLNLCTKDLDKLNKKVQNLFNVLYDTHGFFKNSAIRQISLYSMEEALFKNKRNTIKPYSVRWFSMKGALERMFELYEPVMKCLYEHLNDKTEGVRLEAIRLAKVLKHEDFILYGSLLYDLLQILSHTSTLFQRRSLSILEVRIAVETVTQILADEYFGENSRKGPILNDTLKQISSKTFKKIHINFSSAPKELHEDIKSLVTYLIGDLGEILSDNPLMSCFEVLDLKFLQDKLSIKNVNTLGNLEIENLCRFYSSYNSNFHKIVTPALNHEWLLFKNHILRNHMKSDMLSVVKTIEANKWNNLDKLYDAYHSLILSTVECERSFSRMNFIKNKHRTNLSNETLDNLLLLSTYQGPVRDFDFSKAYQIWNSQRTRNPKLTPDEKVQERDGNGMKQ